MKPDWKVEVLWDLYTVAVGIDILVGVERFEQGLPWGICELIDYMPNIGQNINELEDLLGKRPKTYSSFTGFWWNPHDWNIRSKAILKAIKKHKYIK